MISKTPIPQGQDVRTTRAWHNSLEMRLRRKEQQRRNGRDIIGGTSETGVAVIGVAELTGSTVTIDEVDYPTADIYRGEKAERKVAEGVAVYIQNPPEDVDWSDYEGVRVLAVKYGDFWEGHLWIGQAQIDLEEEVDLTPQLRVHEDGGDYTVEVRMKKLTFEIDEESGLAKPVASDTWGAWHSVDACPPAEDYTEIYGGDI